MNFRIKIAKGITWGPSGFRFKVGKHATIGRSGLLFFGKRGSIWVPTRKAGIQRSDWHTTDGNFIYDHEIRKLIPTWYYNAKNGRNKPGTCAYQQVRPPKTAGRPRVFI